MRLRRWGEDGTASLERGKRSEVNGQRLEAEGLLDSGCTADEWKMMTWIF